MKNSTIVIQRNGEINFLYDEGLEGLTRLGLAEVKRLSEIEFCEENQCWEVKIKGTVMAGFRKRSEALKWEREYFGKRISKEV